MGYIDGDRYIAQVTIVFEFTSRSANDARVLHIDRVGDHRGSRIGLRGGSGQHRHAVGDAQREAAPAPAAGGHAAHGLRAVHFKLALCQ